MSTSSRSADTVRLHVRAATRAAEIVVVDASFALVQRSIGRLDVELPPGLYKVKVREGNTVQERPLLLRPGSSALLDAPPGVTVSEGPDGVTLQYPPQRFASAAPLGQTSRSHEYQRDAARAHSLKVHIDHKGNSQVFAFARQWTPEDAKGPPRSHPATGVTLHDLEGRRLADFGQDSAAEFDRDPWAACTVSLPAGTYCLRRSVAREEPQEQAIVAAPGWQTQVFLLSEPAEPSRARKAAKASAILFARVGQGFDAWDESLRLTELARWGLANARGVLDQWTLEAMLHGKFENPMLGILAGHVLLQRGPQGSEEVYGKTIAEILSNLRRLVGPIADVEALALALEVPLQDPRAFDRPPMLSSSWSLALQRCLSDPELIAPGSRAWAISDHVWVDPPWLAWTARPAPVAPAAPSAVRAAAPAAEPEALPSMEDFALGSAYETSDLEAAPAPPPAFLPAPKSAAPVHRPKAADLPALLDAVRQELAHVDELPELTEMEELVVSALVSRGRYVEADPKTGHQHLRTRRTTTESRPPTPEWLVRRLGTPPLRLAGELQDLLRKLAPEHPLVVSLNDEP